MGSALAKELIVLCSGLINCTFWGGSVFSKLIRLGGGAQVLCLRASCPVIFNEQGKALFGGYGGQRSIRPEQREGENIRNGYPLLGLGRAPKN